MNLEPMKEKYGQDLPPYELISLHLQESQNFISFTQATLNIVRDYVSDVFSYQFLLETFLDEINFELTNIKRHISNKQNPTQEQIPPKKREEIDHRIEKPAHGEKIYLHHHTPQQFTVLAFEIVWNSRKFMASAKDHVTFLNLLQFETQFRLKNLTQLIEENKVPFRSHLNKTGGG